MAHAGSIITQGSSDDPTVRRFKLTAEGKLTPIAATREAITFQRVASLPMAALRATTAYLLPHGYPHTVSASYSPYALWAAAGMMFSSVSGVLSMQSLLYAVGLGAGSIPLAAAVNWVLKDGLGQFGGVLYAALIATRFDSDPKRWRFLSALAQDASTLLEVLTPLVPAAFLPLAAIANVGKNIAWLSASATRAGIHQTLALRGNLADVTGKAGSQTIAASTAGTILGVIISPLVGTDPSNILIAFAVLSLCHLSCIYRALTEVALPTVSDQRLQLACSHLLHTATTGGAGQAAAPDSDATTLAVNTRVLTPEQVQTLESFSPIPWQYSLGVSARVRAALRNAFMMSAGSDGGMYAPLTPSSFGSASTLTALTRPPPPLHYVAIGPPLGDVDHFAEFAAASRLPTSQYIVAVKRWAPHDARAALAKLSSPSDAQVQLLMTRTAAWRDVIIGYLHAAYVARSLTLHAAAMTGTSATAVAVRLHSDLELVARGSLFAAEYGDRALQDLEAAGWWVGQPLLEQDGTRRIAEEGAPDDAMPQTTASPASMHDAVRAPELAPAASRDAPAGVV